MTAYYVIPTSLNEVSLSVHLCAYNLWGWDHIEQRAENRVTTSVKRSTTLCLIAFQNSATCPKVPLDALPNHIPAEDDHRATDGGDGDGDRHHYHDARAYDGPKDDDSNVGGSTEDDVHGNRVDQAHADDLAEPYEGGANSTPGDLHAPAHSIQLEDFQRQAHTCDRQQDVRVGAFLGRTGLDDGDLIQGGIQSDYQYARVHSDFSTLIPLSPVSSHPRTQNLVESLAADMIQAVGRTSPSSDPSSSPSLAHTPSHREHTAWRIKHPCVLVRSLRVERP